MKQMRYMFNHSYRVVAGLALVLVLFSACKKDHFDNNQQQQATHAAGLMAFNLSPDQSAAGVDVAGNRLTNAALGYTNFTGSYLSIDPGTSEVRFFDYGTGSTLALNAANFADSSYYSSFLLGVNGNYRNVIVQDRLAPLTVATGKLWVRYINAIPDTTSSPVINISAAGDSAISEMAPYAHVSDFVQVNAGQVNVSVSNGSTIAASRTIDLEENKVYTLLFTGLPLATDSANVVQVKYIQNGIVVP